MTLPQFAEIRLVIAAQRSKINQLELTIVIIAEHFKILWVLGSFYRLDSLVCFSKAELGVALKLNRLFFSLVIDDQKDPLLAHP